MGNFIPDFTDVQKDTDTASSPSTSQTKSADQTISSGVMHKSNTFGFDRNLPAVQIQVPTNHSNDSRVCDIFTEGLKKSSSTFKAVSQGPYHNNSLKHKIPLIDSPLPLSGKRKERVRYHLFLLLSNSFQLVPKKKLRNSLSSSTMLTSKKVVDFIEIVDDPIEIDLFEEAPRSSLSQKIQSKSSKLEKIKSFNIPLNTSDRSPNQSISSPIKSHSTANSRPQSQQSESTIPFQPVSSEKVTTTTPTYTNPPKPATPHSKIQQLNYASSTTIPKQAKAIMNQTRTQKEISQFATKLGSFPAVDVSLAFSFQKNTEVFKKFDKPGMKVRFFAVVDLLDSKGNKIEEIPELDIDVLKFFYNDEMIATNIVTSRFEYLFISHTLKITPTPIINSLKRAAVTQNAVFVEATDPSWMMIAAKFKLDVKGIDDYKCPKEDTSKKQIKLVENLKRKDGKIVDKKVYKTKFKMVESEKFGNEGEVSTNEKELVRKDYVPDNVKKRKVEETTKKFGEMFVYSPESKISVKIGYEDFARLDEGEFLDDTIIEFYLKGEGLKAEDDAYECVKSWTSKVDLFEKDFLFIPINENLHWYLGVIYNPKALLDINIIDSESELNSDIEDFLTDPPTPHPIHAKQMSKVALESESDAETKMFVVDETDNPSGNKVKGINSIGSLVNLEPLIDNFREKPMYRGRMDRSYLFVFDSLRGSVRTTVLNRLLGYLKREAKFRKDIDVCRTIKDLYPR
ncbi:hypothetical protein HK096_002689, partial [Nowakowskiella sp. JEL0078]